MTRQRSIHINTSSFNFVVANTASFPFLLYQIFLSEQKYSPKIHEPERIICHIVHRHILISLPHSAVYGNHTVLHKFTLIFFLFSPGAVGLRLCGISASTGSTVPLPGDTNESGANLGLGRLGSCLGR